MDKFLKIGLGLGGVSAVASISYWATQYESHLPNFNNKPALTITQQKRLNNPYYKKITEAENKVGCKFYLILDSSSKSTYGLLNEDKVTDELIKGLSENIDEDANTNGRDVTLNINNMKKKCNRHDKNLRIILSKKSSTEKYKFEVRTNEQGPGYDIVD